MVAIKEQASGQSKGQVVRTRIALVYAQCYAISMKVMQESGRSWLGYALVAVWTPLAMVLGAVAISGKVEAPLVMAYFALGCLLLSLVFLWLAVVQMVKRRVKVADFLLIALYGIGGFLYSFLTKALQAAQAN
jgi:hypothetical protein